MVYHKSGLVGDGLPHIFGHNGLPKPLVSLAMVYHKSLNRLAIVYHKSLVRLTIVYHKSLVSLAMVYHKSSVRLVMVYHKSSVRLVMVYHKSLVVMVYPSFGQLGDGLPKPLVSLVMYTSLQSSWRWSTSLWS